MDAPEVCDCGRRIEQPATGRRRSKCLVCSPPDRRTVTGSRRQPRVGAPSATVAALPDRPAADGPLTAATRGELEKAGRAGSALGVAALVAAATVDRGGMTANGLAALLRAHRDALAEALADAEPAADPLAEIGERWAAETA